MKRSEFESLPDDAILQILDKLWDAKLLFRCSTVCRRFASLTPRVHNVCLSLKPNSAMGALVLFSVNILGNDDPNSLKRFSSYDDLINSLKLSLPLSHFREIHHLRLELPLLPPIARKDDAVEWGITLSGEKLKSFAVLSVAHIYPFFGPIPPISFDNSWKERSYCQYAIFAIVSQVLLLALIKTHPGLRGITIVDASNTGTRRELGGDSLVRLRELVSSIPSESLWQGVQDLKVRDTKFCIKDSIPLPVSGYIMDGVKLVMIQFQEDCSAAEGISHGAVQDCFEGDIYKEAVKELLRDKQHIVG